MVAGTEEINVSAVVCLGYPLKVICSLCVTSYNITSYK